MLLQKTFIALASLITIIIYDRHIFIVQGPGFEFLRSKLVRTWTILNGKLC